MSNTLRKFLRGVREDAGGEAPAAGAKQSTFFFLLPFIITYAYTPRISGG